MKKVFMVLFFCLFLVACQRKINTKFSGTNDKSLDNIIKIQMDLEENKIKNEEDSILKWDDEEYNKNLEKDESVDYDLTVLDADLVYANIYALMIEPEKYIGKTYKMRGKYYPSYYAKDDKYYHYIILEDALACCSQGIEFKLENEKIYSELVHGEMIEIKGVFENYRDEGDDRYFSRLNNVSLEFIN